MIHFRNDRFKACRPRRLPLFAGVLAFAASFASFPSPASYAGAQQTGNSVLDGTAAIAPTVSAGQPAAANPNVLPAESLGPDDLLEVMVSYCPELSRSFRVSSNGTLALPLLQKKLPVTGLTPTEVADLLQKELNEEHILTDATVNISVLEYRSRPVSVVGAVAHPLTFQATGQTTLLDAVAKAGGLAANAGGTIIITAKSSSTAAAGGAAADQHADQHIVQIIPVKDLMSGSSPESNFEIHGGEEIRIPEAASIFVAGNVRHPGMFPMQSDGETTVVKALALSSGLAEYNANIAFIYRRRKVGSERDELSVPLSKIMAHKAPDVMMMADDILFVPGSDGKRLTGKILNQLAGFGSAAGVGLLVYK